MSIFLGNEQLVNSSFSLMKERLNVVLSFRNLNEAILAYYDAEMPTDKVPQMRFVADVTVGEGEAIPPNTRFVKTWRVENPSEWRNECLAEHHDRFSSRQRSLAESLFVTFCQWRSFARSRRDLRWIVGAA